jgi:ferredoxin
MAELSQRLSENVTGRYFVDNTCIDCDLCRETAPGNFARNDARGFSFVSMQPNRPEEETSCRQAMEECPVEAIGIDASA